MVGPDQQNLKARALFDGIADRYDGPAEALSLFQYSGWRHFLVSRLEAGPETRVLDVATGTGAVAFDLAKKTHSQVIGVDLSNRMLRKAWANTQTSPLNLQVSLVAARAENLPFADQSFDALVFTYLLRYVKEPQPVLRELVRVLKPGGQIASLEFFVPQGPILHPLWLLYTRLVLPISANFLSPGWGEVGSFLGPSIASFSKRYSLGDLTEMWQLAGLGQIRVKLLSLGGAFVMWGKKEVAK